MAPAHTFSNGYRISRVYPYGKLWSVSTQHINCRIFCTEAGAIRFARTAAGLPAAEKKSA